MEAKKSDLARFEEDLAKLTELERSCFLCGSSLLPGEYTDEHVVPLWAQKRYDLLDQKLILLNNTSIPYRQLTVPCCGPCNRDHLRSLEDSLSATVDVGVEAVRALGDRTLFLWLGKLLYGVLYKESLLAADRRNPSAGTILTVEALRSIHVHRLMLQQVRGKLNLREGQAASIFAWPAQELAAPRHRWDLIDNAETLFIACRVGSVALFASLADGGAMKACESVHDAFKDLPLHPLQFRELAARMSYWSTRGTRTPKFVTIESSPHEMIQTPLWGMSMKPLFDTFEPEVYAQYLAFYTGLPLEQVLSPSGATVTWLTDEDGRARFMDVRD